MAVTDTHVIGDYTAAITIDGATHFLLIQPGNASTAYKKISRNVFLAITGDPVGTTDSQALTNKTIGNTNTVTLKDTLFTLQDDGDATKQARFQLSGITTATTRTYTLPNRSDTLVDLGSSQTLTSKTLTAPTISGGSVSNSTIAVDAIAEFTPANGVTIDGLNLKDGKLNTNNSVVTANITDAAVTPAKLVAGTGSTWAWPSWVPTWTNFTLGNGTQVAKYIQIGNTVFARLEVTLGSTSSMGTNPIFTLPITSVALASGGANVSPLGTINISDSGTAQYMGTLKWRDTTAAIMQYSDDTASGIRTDNAITSTAPMNWTTNDGFFVNFFYEAAS